MGIRNKMTIRRNQKRLLCEILKRRPEKYETRLRKFFRFGAFHPNENKEQSRRNREMGGQTTHLENETGCYTNVSLD
jgi:hypothetical protein